MQTLDHDVAAEYLERCEKIRPDARPAWGSFSPQAMIRHLADEVRYSMGKSGELPFTGTWLTRMVAGPLILRGVMPMPKNLKAGLFVPDPADLGPVSGEIETLHAVLDEYLHVVQTGEIDPPPHPMLGDIGVDGWAKLHVVHFEHHLRQFNV